MSDAHDAILKAAMELPVDERFALAEKLFASMPDEPDLWDIDDPEFIAELRRRANDGLPTIPWSEVRKELFADDDR
ncbi:Putative addiction module component [Caulifigura coniformis]|uniref:Addiction module component n=1 Tax=Caulifigura coniformis TaxID=2527983 RepID=A0A517SN39_9PLAN|nr:hypothetical protein [Caulifigura coniformis]QDT57516.1 Putative addiction module component [Caulifigura coniformis]